MRSTLLAPSCALLGALAGVACAQPALGPTVGDVVEFKRVVQPQDQNDDALPEQIAPNGKQAFIVTRRSDVASDKNRYEILLLDVTADHLASNTEAGPESILSITPGHDNSYGAPAIQNVQWHGDRTLVFMARLTGDLFQVYRLDVPTRKLVQLTHETNLIKSFAASEDMRRVVYAVQVPNPPLKVGAHGVVVGAQSFWAVKFGQHDLASQDRVFQYFVADTASPRPARPLGKAFPDRFAGRPIVSMSPDGRWALLPRWEPERLVGWERDYPMIAELSRTYGFGQKIDPLSYFTRPISYVPRRMTAWRLDDAKEQTVVDAPDDALPGSSQLRADRLWQGTGDSVVLAGTHLPIVQGGQQSPGSYVIEYWPKTGQWTPVAALQSHLEQAHALLDGFMVIDGDTRREFHRQAGGGWREATGVTQENPGRKSAWALHITQGLNQPADLYATGPAGEIRRLTVLNPQFNPDTWGAMERYTWRDANGGQWDGGLMSASGIDSHARHPLIIETYGFTPDRFYLEGANWGDGFTSAFAGRAFLREGILVLQMPLGPTGAHGQTERAAQQSFDDGVRGAIDTLVKEGRVDPAKVGIMGWSHTGQRVLNLLTYDDIPIRAATMADGDANTLFAQTVTFGRSDGMLQGTEESNDGQPYGSKLPNWVRNDPSLHTDCIRAALRIESYGLPVYNNWDIYALLRRQYKAAEMIVIPDGTHSLSTPGDRMASLQGNVDWYAFWLAGKTRTAPLLSSETTSLIAAQYAQWRQMEALKTADDSRPRCAR